MILFGTESRLETLEHRVLGQRSRQVNQILQSRRILADRLTTLGDTSLGQVSFSASFNVGNYSRNRGWPQAA